MKKTIILKTSLLAICATLCVPGLYADDQRKPAQVQMEWQQKNSPQQFVRDALSSGQREIRLGELALRKSEDARIKSFARDMVQDHSKANMELREIALRKGFETPGIDNYNTASTPRTPVGQESALNTPAVGSEDRPQDTSKRAGSSEVAKQYPTDEPDDLDIADTDVDVAAEADKAGKRLEGLSGVEFDRSFVKVMVSDHKKAVSQFESASKYLADAELKAFASKTLPTLRTHLEHAQKLDRDYSSGRDDVSSAK